VGVELTLNEIYWVEPVCQEWRTQKLGSLPFIVPYSVSLDQTERKNMSAVKKLTNCQIQLRDMCKNIAEGITEGKNASHWFDDGNDVYNIEWITHQDKTYKSARLMVAGGGPNIWVNLQRNVVQGYWWGDYCECPFADNIGLDEYCEEMYGC
tara:strand:+ start:544 stop:999 length:456 start_codon:yes stop_codon:yes gene_type:complete